MKRTKGFTLIELLIVLIIIAILAILGFYTFDGFQEKAKASKVKQNCSSAVNFITNTFVFCKMNPNSTIALKTGGRIFTKVGGKMKGVPDPKIEQVPCDKSKTPTMTMLTKIMNHLNNEGHTNPYGMVGGYDDGIVGPYPVCHPGSGRCYEDFLLNENKYQYQCLGRCMIQGDTTGRGAVQGFYEPGTAKGMGCCSKTNQALKWTSNTKFFDVR